MFERPADADPTVTGPPPVDADTGATGDLLAFDRLAASDAASTPVAASDPTVVALPTIPGYVVHRLLGEGGMGAVYLATDTRLRKDVALKVLSVAEAGDLMRRRFADEAATLAKFDHPNIVRVFCAGEANGWLYFAMTYLPLGSLDRHLKAVRRDAATVVGLLAKVARAVHHLHAGDVLHRDLKPQNILLADGGEPQVADFGIAKMTDGDDRTPTQTGLRLGTYAYMAPEMIRHGVTACGPAVDVWALGLMLFELLAGRRPFPGSGRDPNLMFRIVTHAPPSLLAEPDLTPGTDDRLEAITLRALAKDPVNRYPSAAELAADLEQWLGGQLPPAPLELLTKRRQHAAPQPSSVAVDPNAPTVTVAPPSSAPTRPRRRWRGVGWLAAGLLLATVAIAVAAWPKDVSSAESEPQLTLAQRLDLEGEVPVIDKDGNALVPITEVAGSQGGVKAGQNKYFAVTGGPVTLAEISSEVIPFPFVIEADIRHEFGTPGSSLVGVYAGRRGHAVAGNPPPHPEDAFYALALDTCATIDPVPRPGTAAAGGIWFAPSDYSDFRFVSKFLSNAPPLRHRRLGEGGERTYLRIQLEIHPERFQPAVGGNSFRGDTRRDLAGKFGGAVFVPSDRPLPQQLLGDGFGLFAREGTGAFRAVWLRKAKS